MHAQVAKQTCTGTRAILWRAILAKMDVFESGVGVFESGVGYLNLG
jgi:hypothetical protein